MTEVKTTSTADAGGEDHECCGLLLTAASRSSTSAQKPADAPKQTLLSLPPEMRNRIYRYVLLETEPIRTTPSRTPPPQPGLLSTCRQIRKESLDIYYQENKFKIHVVHFDSRQLAEFNARSSAQCLANVSVTIANSNNWSNLMH